ncbi:MAG: hypothetical protein JWN30_2340 [Bacilli bacterium]|nr:hypothetical protein [Bacilli bacterium]
MGSGLPKLRKFLIVNADDFGLSPGLNRGIIKAHCAGVVLSTSVMANMTWFFDAMCLAQKVPDLGVGMHFNVTEGKPVSSPGQVPSLVDDSGQFFSMAYASQWRKEDVDKELEAQWAKFTASGFRPTHLNSHHHVQRYPTVYEAMVIFANQVQVPMRLTGPDMPGPRHAPSTDCLINDVYFVGEGLNRLLLHLDRLQPGVTELVCHPGYVDEYLIVASTWSEVREIELQVLTNPLVLAAIHSLDIELIHYGQL